MDQSVQAMVDYPKRVRYTALPNQNFDQKFNAEQQSKQYEELVELQAYQWMRIESFKNFKLQIKIPGNLDLYAGLESRSSFPGTYKKNGKMNIDKKYSGRYVIANVSQQVVGSELTTELLLLKRFHCIINSNVSLQHTTYGKRRKAHSTRQRNPSRS